MMAKEPAQRYQSAAEVAEALAVWTPSGAAASEGLEPLEAAPTLTAGDGPGAGTKTGPSSSGGGAAAPGRQVRGNKRGWAVALGLACVLVLGGAVGFALYRAALPRTPEGDRPGAQPGPAAGSARPRLRLLVPAYFYPGGEGLAQWQRLLQAPDPAAVVIIVNTASGPGEKVNPHFARVVDQARAKGFTLVGYVSTRYGKRPAEEVKEDVDRWTRFYPGVEGIFFDEQASAAKAINYYAGLYEYTRKRRGLRQVVSNPGTACAEEYLARPAADIVCLVESTKALSQFRSPPWAAAYPAGRFAALLHTVAEPGRMKQDVLAMAGKRLGYCYITDRAPPNPWDRLPGYWEAELAAVRQANDRNERQEP
jgi:hypothetical protein